MLAKGGSSYYFSSRSQIFRPSIALLLSCYGISCVAVMLLLCPHVLFSNFYAYAAYLWCNYVIACVAVMLYLNYLEKVKTPAKSHTHCMINV